MTASNDFLIRHAFNNIWSLPDNNNCLTIKPSRISGEEGVTGSFSHLWSTYNLPVANKVFHVFQLGKIDYKLLKLNPNDVNKWMRITEMHKTANVLLSVFTASGLNIPRHLCYFRVSSDRNMVLVIEQPASDQLNIVKGDIHFKIYNNSLYNHPENSGLPDPLTIGGGRIKADFTPSDAQILAQQSSNGNTEGQLICTCNGLYISMIRPVVVNEGDDVDWYFDATITRQIDYPVKSLLTYHSKVDDEKFLILNHAVNVTSIEHIDNIDFYVVSPEVIGDKGILINKQVNTNAIKMLTHRDYSISLVEVQKRADMLGVDISRCVIRAFFRRSPLVRPLVYEHDRLSELYKLDYATRRAIMAGYYGPECWRAVNLENSAYVKLMSANFLNMTKQQVQDAYGYSAITKILGDTPSKPSIVNNKLTVDIPVGLRHACTAYEFNECGKLTFVTPTSGEKFVCKGTDTAWVEIVSGIAGTNIDLVTSTNSGHFDKEHNYRFYRKVQGAWKDVSTTSAVIINADIWIIDAEAGQCAALSDKRHIFIEHEIPTNSSSVLTGLIGHKIEGRMVPLPFNMGEYDVYLNDSPLVEGIDFVVDFPYVRVINRDMIDESVPKQCLAIRAMNFCNEDMTYRKPEEVGFVKGGVLSNNAKFDMRDDRVFSIYCGGSYYDKSEVTMAETTGDVFIGEQNDGMPYAINHLIVPMRNFIVSDKHPIDTTEKARLRSLERDAEIDEYLASTVQEVHPVSPCECYTVNQLYSPFFSAILHDMGTNYFWDPRFDTNELIDDAELEFMLNHYKPMLIGDPVNNLDADFIKYTTVHPSINDNVVQMTLTQKVILDRIVAKYGNGRIEVDHLVSIKL